MHQSVASLLIAASKHYPVALVSVLLWPGIFRAVGKQLSQGRVGCGFGIQYISAGVWRFIVSGFDAITRQSATCPSGTGPRFARPAIATLCARKNLSTLNTRLVNERKIRGYLDKF